MLERANATSPTNAPPTGPCALGPDRSPLPRLAYAPAEVATIVGLSRSKVMQLLADGDIPSVKIDRSRRVLHADLVAWLDALRHAVPRIEPDPELGRDAVPGIEPVREVYLPRTPTSPRPPSADGAQLRGTLS